MHTIQAIDLFYSIGTHSCSARAAGIASAACFDKRLLAGQVFQDNFPQARCYNVDLVIHYLLDLAHLVCLKRRQPLYTQCPLNIWCTFATQESTA